MMAEPVPVRAVILFSAVSFLVLCLSTTTFFFLRLVRVSACYSLLVFLSSGTPFHSLRFVARLAGSEMRYHDGGRANLC